MRELRDDAWALLRDGAAMLWARRWWILGFLVLLVGLALLIVPHDKAWVAAVSTPPQPGLKALAWALTDWGDYHTGSSFLALALLLAGYVRHSRALRRAALAAFLSASVAGAVVNVPRLLLGRPRPIAELPDGLYGPHLGFKWHSMPSGHSATSMGTASALLVALPVVGVPAVLAAGGVVWSRVYLRHHHPSDVLVGASFGWLFGVAIGLAARRRSRAERAGR